MQDRTPLYPGRVKLVPVEGHTNVYDMTREDSPTQPGTPLSKATLLKDATAALYGLGSDAVPDDVLSLLSRFQFGLGNEYVWAKRQELMVETYYGLDVPTYFYIAYNRSSANVPFSDTVAFNDDGSAYLVNPQTITLNNSNKATVAATLSGKYVDNTTIASGANANIVGIFKFPINDTILYISDVGFFLSSCYNGGTGKLMVKGVKHSTLIGYVNSPNENAYPPTVSDGYTYTALGQLGNKVRIATGSYTGTGTYGKSNPNSLTFEFPVKVLFITAYFQEPYDIAEVGSYTGGSDAYTTGSIVETWPTTFTSGVGFGQSSYKYGRKSADGKTFEWYTFGGGDYAYYQANESGKIYRYIAIG